MWKRERIGEPRTVRPLGSFLGAQWKWRVSTFNWLEVSVYGTFITATQQSRPGMHHFRQALDINHNSSALPRIMQHKGLAFFYVGVLETEKNDNNGETS